MVKYRNNKGAAIISLTLLLSMVVLMLGLFAVEVARYCLAQQQLSACVESAALAASATNAGSNNLNALQAQQTAIATSLNIFQKQTILGKPLTNATQASSITMNPAANQAQLYFQFLDPITRQPVVLGSTNGKILQVNGAFGVQPMFGTYLNLASTYTATALGYSSLPSMDVVLAFDLSSSMDDFTPVSIVSRYKLNGTTNGYGVLNQGPLYTAFNCTNATGTAVNATFPQNLDSSGSGGQGSYTFSSSSRGVNHGQPAAGSKSTTQFTDLVVNIDGTNTFNTGITINGFFFPANNIGLLVEAARGNLESTTVATAANVPYKTWGITPKAGYYQAYLQGALSQRHPIGDAITAAQNFFTILNNDTDVHLSLVTFGSKTGLNSSSVAPSTYSKTGNITDNPSSYSSNLDPSDPVNPNPPNPTIELDPVLGPTHSNYSLVESGLINLLAYGSTDIAGGLSESLNQLLPTSKGGKNLGRVGTTKVIILFTDGLPTASSIGSSPYGDARGIAVKANSAGIPIYSIGLCLTPNLQSSQTAFLTDQNSDPVAGGITGIAGNGGVFYQATSIAELQLIFENTARSLVQLIN